MIEEVIQRGLDGIDHLLVHNPRLCAVLTVFILHQYIQSFHMRRVLGMRAGDGIWLMPPRLAPGEVRPWWKWILYVFWKPKRPTPVRKRPKTMPPQEPPAVDFSDAKTPKV